MPVVVVAFLVAAFVVIVAAAAVRLVILLNGFLRAHKNNLATFQLEVGVVDWNCSICVCCSDSSVDCDGDGNSELISQRVAVLRQS